MDETDIQLIQGPPGTGKTHTINGILSMLYFSKKKVLVCAPSNTAVNEIVYRLDKERFYDDVKKNHPEGRLVRIEGLGYESPEEIQKYSLDWRINKALELAFEDEGIEYS